MYEGGRRGLLGPTRRHHRHLRPVEQVLHHQRDAHRQHPPDNIKSNTVLIDTAVETFDKIYENIAESNNLVIEMIDGVTKVDDVATNVAAISQEQAASADEILETSKQMVEQADNITRNSEDVAANSEELASTSNKLTSYVSKFKLGSEYDDEEV